MTRRPLVLVTGAATGIGKATVEAFANAGQTVVATMRRPDDAPQYDAPRERISILRLDVTDEPSITEAVVKIETEIGPIGTLVNNAGFGLVGPFEVIDPAEVRRVFETNVFGLMATTRAVLPLMRQRKSGVIINVASVGGRVTFPFYSVYHATKWAVEGFTESLAYELREHGIRVKIIEPGPIATEFYGRGEARPPTDALGVYGRTFTRSYQRMNASGTSAPGPQIVAKAILQAASDTSSRLRYSPNARALLILRAAIGDRNWVRYVGRWLGA